MNEIMTPPIVHRIEIRLEEGRWLINNKRYEDCSEREKQFIDDFFHDIKKNSDEDKSE